MGFAWLWKLERKLFPLSFTLVWNVQGAKPPGAGINYQEFSNF